MIPEIRKRYNASFTQARYDAFLQDIYRAFNHRPSFRIAETPVFVPKGLKAKLFEAVEDILKVILRPDFRDLSEGAILAGQKVPGETPHTTFLQMDFGICKDEAGNLTPQLIEVQGFPSLYFYQHLVAKLYRKHFTVPEHFRHLFSDLEDESYIELLRRVIVGDTPPEQTILLEVEPHKQTTQIDFWGTRHYLGTPVLCVTDLKRSGRDLYYINEQGKKVAVRKIYNRVIFDELIRRDDLQREFYFTEEADVEWVGHPHWFFRISKHTLPLIKSPYVPESHFLNELEGYPEQLDQYVLKPLFSFSGTGVIINLNKYDLEAIEDPENYILQRKVEYQPIVETPTGPAKVEIRILMLWERGKPKPILVNNLARLSKGIMIGVKYNKDKDWVGGSVGFFEPD